MSETTPERFEAAVSPDNFGETHQMNDKFAEKDQGSGVETINAARYTSDVLKKNPEVRDSYDRPRPTYEVGGRKVIFRNRMEIVDMSGRGVTVVAANTVRPLDTSRLREPEKYPMEELDSFNQNHAQDSEGNILSIPNTPLGIAEAAVALGLEDVIPLRDKLLRGEYTDPECEQYIDGLLGALTVDDNGEALDEYNVDGYAVMLASLSGDETARGIVASKRAAVVRLEAERKQANKDNTESFIQERRDQGLALPEPLPLEKMFMVHSTSHELEFDDQGNAVFKPSGQYDTDPTTAARASWHVTINSGVFPHTRANDAWGSQDRLVVASLTETMQQNPNRLEVLDGVDTWFAVSPGEKISVPSATIIEPIVDGEQLVQRDGNRVRFLSKEHYSEDEQMQILLLAGQYGAANIDALKHRDTIGLDTLKEACLQMVLSEKGVSLSGRDQPSTDGHGMASNQLAQQVMATAYSLGLRSGKHFDSAENRLEDQSYGQLVAVARQTLGSTQLEHWTYARPGNAAALSTRRQALVSGSLPAADWHIQVAEEQWA